MQISAPPDDVKNPHKVLRDRLFGAVSRNSHIWARDPHDWYVEDLWCSRRLFEEEKFHGEIYDPNCGWGRILRSAKDAGYAVRASDIVIRPSGDAEIEAIKYQADLLALKLAKYKVAIIFPVARLNAAHWLTDAPLRRVWLMTPRPPMPPGYYLEAGHKPAGGRVDFCWLILEHGYSGEAEMRWLRRDAR
jgi:hypothetical protein